MMLQLVQLFACNTKSMRNDEGKHCWWWRIDLCCLCAV